MSGTVDAGTAGAGTDAGAGTAPLAGIAVPGEGNISTGHEAAVDYEKVAREKGWKPREEFEGEGDVWVAPEEFVKRQPLFDKIKVQNKQLKELTKTVEALAKHYNTSIEQAKARAIVDLKLERKEAIELGEVTRVEELDTRIEQVKQMETVTTPKSDTEIDKFVDEHSSWFNVDKAMTRFAVTFNESYLADNPGKMKESLEETLKAVKAAYPDKFENKRRSDPPPVEGGDGSGQGQGGKYTMNRLSPEQKLVYSQLVTRHKQMTHDEYFKQLDDVGYLEK